MTGSILYLLEKSSNFARSFKKLAKNYNPDFIATVANCLEALILDPYPSKSRDEPLPKRTRLPQGWTFHKLELWVRKGASGQIRIMYLVNEELREIKLFWIYNHEQFSKRPSDDEIDDAIKEFFL
jgi:mRNA-degrading endonuclease YafQ of YafQ-DinJ toxin-antitoxin module